MACSDSQPATDAEALAQRQAVIAAQFARGDTEAALRHRRTSCLKGTPCGWPCERFFKGVGKLCYCRNPETGEAVLLQSALMEPGFACDLGLF